MNWTTLLGETFEYQYAVADQLLDLVKDSELNWKPATGSNWMTVGQLLFHITNCCGEVVKGFVTGDWGLPPNVKLTDIPMDQMLPPAEALKSVQSVAEAKRLLAEDKKLAFEMLSRCSEERLDQEIVRVPWDKMELSLARRMMEMALHLMQHKGQLFYYLKLMGKPVNTGHLWGM